MPPPTQSRIQIISILEAAECSRSPAKRRHVSDNTPATRAPAPVYGPIKGVAIFTKWATRKDCYYSGVHCAQEAGICGPVSTGATSIAMTGGADDIDEGERVTYTGSGGGKKTRNAIQTEDQEFTRLNLALKNSVETGQPVRLIRGSGLNSKYAPAEGCRYDGLYLVTKAYYDKDPETNLRQCKYELQRIPGQPPIPIAAPKINSTRIKKALRRRETRKVDTSSAARRVAARKAQMEKVEQSSEEEEDKELRVRMPQRRRVALD